MRAAFYTENGAAREVLQIGDVDLPTPGPKEVRVRIIASGVNPSDVKARAGLRSMDHARVIPQGDGAGIVDAVGLGVPGSRIGQRVWIWNGQWHRADGSAAEAIVLPEDHAVLLPDNIGFAEGACFGVPLFTAWQAVATDGGVKGQRVLVQGGAGAVGHYAIQIAKLKGAKSIIATVSSEAKAAHARAAGADYVINYKTDDAGQRIRALTNGGGVDRVIEVDAAANIDLIPQVLAPNAIVVVYGSSKPTIAFNFMPLIMRGTAFRFFIVYNMDNGMRALAIKDLTAMLSSEVLQHTVAKIYPLDEIAAAHEAVEAGKLIGNVIVTVSAEEIARAILKGRTA
jgi:NADPH:quinone reductase